MHCWKSVLNHSFRLMNWAKLGLVFWPHGSMLCFFSVNFSQTMRSSDTIYKVCLLLAIRKTIYLRFFLKSLDVTENKDICMFLFVTVTEECWFCWILTSFVNLLLDLAMGFLEMYLFIFHVIAKNQTLNLLICSSQLLCLG